ncbi:hypothetical protein KIPB_001957 [Kipferlia bialata]|uniref:Uncharacterized protein n=1 Tax=Kipferlia bialata TaxID=797122 RepID=A0A9K3GFU3_9EUKA|nr:hypothetical protein KIPB_001957 [Kipferlia bialata]|eukprot:g1957.t1
MAIPTIPELPISVHSDWPVFAEDVYGFNHPLFNVSVIADIHVYMEQDVLDEMYAPANFQYDDYYPASSM